MKITRSPCISRTHISEELSIVCLSDNESEQKDRKTKAHIGVLDPHRTVTLQGSNIRCINIIGSLVLC